MKKSPDSSPAAAPKAKALRVPKAAKGKKRAPKELSPGARKKGAAASRARRPAAVAPKAPARSLPRIPPEAPSLVAVLGAVIILLSLFSFSPQDYPQAGEGRLVANHIGFLGAWGAHGLYRLFGLLAVWPALLLALFPYYALTAYGKTLSRLAVALGLALFLCALLALFSLTWPKIPFFARLAAFSGGGAAGDFMARSARELLGGVGAYILLPPLALAGFFLWSGITLSALRKVWGVFAAPSGAAEGESAATGEELALGLPRVQDFAGTAREALLGEETPATPVSPEAPPLLPLVPRVVEKAPPASPEKPLTLSHAEGPYKFPDLDLLDPPSPENAAPELHRSKEELTRNAKSLEAKLREFKVEGVVTEVTGGPVITMYEYQPAPGVKIGRVSALATDLAMAMKVEAIRVVAPLPGKAAIGLELPNAARAVVSLRELVESPAYQKQASPLTLVLGVDIVGAPVVTDLGKMPHLLIAGATGSGKSVGLDCMIMSILYKASPAEARFLMIDPKCVELALYQDLPHLLYPVLTDPAEATEALKWALYEMDSRYKLMAEKGVRNIQGYNEMTLEKRGGRPFNPDRDEPTLPYLIIIIDELSDLMIQAPKDVETAIMRLCAKARASGIHLILATQRPSVDVLTGVIKANLPTRISFQVATKFDSRTILDQVGAEMLLGKGDMLFQPPGTSKLRRLHGAYVSDAEKRRVTDFIRANGPPNYLERLSLPESAEEKGGKTERDEKFDEAAELVRSTGKTSISFIQRRLNIGYNRAANLKEALERAGVIGPQEGLKPPLVY
ncbi:MAG: DNA translocase FtsK 4TM domain-containing protein [Deltaproteobacteria bacterium]|jgi:S-DNA-T family DNA segregation ATPase FtsK/SpoIIIE|nr:DNA translocase FtsK 4TM domain-containing protein [Deltaproteobacteria bacterium]